MLNNLKRSKRVYPINIPKYEEFPTLVEGEDIIQKVNLIISQINRQAKTTNEVSMNWNKVMNWVIKEGLVTEFTKALETMKERGELDELLSGVTPKQYVVSSDPPISSDVLWLDVE